MASRIDYSQNRKLYVGTTDEISVADSNAIISGKLGIGVTTSGEKLEIDGNIRIHNSSNAPYIDFVESGAVTDSKARIAMDQIDTDNGLLLFSTEGGGTLSERMRITSGGDVGIGTDSPDLGGVAGTRVLTIASPTAERWGILELAGNRTWGGNQVGELKFISTDATNNGTLVSLIAINDPTATGTGGGLKFNTRPDGGSLTERMLIDSDGLVKFSKTATTGTAVASINHASNDFLYINGGTAGIAIGDDNQNTRMVCYNDDYIRFDSAGVERMRLTPDGNSTFLILKAKPSTYNSKSYLTLYGTNSSTYGGSVIARSSISSETNGGPYGANLKFTTNDNSNVEQTRMTMFGATGAVQLNSYNSTNQIGTPTYLLGADASGNIVKTITGATTGTQVHSLAATGGTSSWKKLGTFTASHGGKSAFIKMVTNNGYNSSIGQNVEVYIRFKTSNGGSLDPNGFSGDSSFYTTGPNGSFPAGNIKWVSDAGGTSATSYALYALIPSYSGDGGFYVVENSAGTWVNNMTNASDPGTASSTIMIPPEQFRVGSTDFVVNGGGGDAYFANSKVGIGRTDPEGTGTDLDVYGAGYFGYQDYRDHNTYPPQKAFVLRGAPASGLYAQSRFNWYTKSGTTSNGIAAIQIKSQYSTDAESDVLFHLGGSGKLGIGTDSPGRKLTVTGDASGDANNLLLANENDTDGDSASIGFSMLSNDTYVKAGIFFKRTTTQGRGDLIFATNNEVNGNNVTSSNAKLTIKNSARIEMSADVTMSGSVGIGETALQRKFNLYDGTDTWTRVQCGASTADWLHGIAGSDHTYKWYNQSSNGGVGYKMELATSGALTLSGPIKGTQYNLNGNATNPATTAATIYDQSGVGLTLSAHNTSFRSYDGSNMMESARLVHDKLTVVGDVIAYGTPSDKRLKENVKPIESALDKAMKLQGVTFDWKESDSILNIKEDIGFIAQDVQKVVPELVRENKDGMLSMRHQGIAPILLEAIKELKAEIEDLKKKIK